MAGIVASSDGADGRMPFFRNGVNNSGILGMALPPLAVPYVPCNKNSTKPPAAPPSGRRRLEQLIHRLLGAADGDGPSAPPAPAPPAPDPAFPPSSGSGARMNLPLFEALWQDDELESRTFSMDFCGEEAMVDVGSPPPPGDELMEYVPCVPTYGVVPAFWIAEVQSIHVGHHHLGKLTHDDLNKPMGGIIIDSGTTETLLPSVVFNAVVSKIVAVCPWALMGYLQGMACVTPKGLATLPDITITLAQKGNKDDVVIKLTPAQYNLNFNGCSFFGIAPSDSIMILGNIALQNSRVVFDAGSVSGEGPRLGFAKSELCGSWHKGEGEGEGEGGGGGGGGDEVQGAGEEEDFSQYFTLITDLAEGEIDLETSERTEAVCMRCDSGEGSEGGGTISDESRCQWQRCAATSDSMAGMVVSPGSRLGSSVGVGGRWSNSAEAHTLSKISDLLGVPLAQSEGSIGSPMAAEGGLNGGFECACARPVSTTAHYLPPVIRHLPSAVYQPPLANLAFEPSVATRPSALTTHSPFTRELAAIVVFVLTAAALAIAATALTARREKVARGYSRIVEMAPIAPATTVQHVNLGV